MVTRTASYTSKDASTTPRRAARSLRVGSSVDEPPRTDSVQEVAPPTARVTSQTAAVRDAARPPPPQQQLSGLGQEGRQGAGHWTALQSCHDIDHMLFGIYFQEVRQANAVLRGLDVKRIQPNFEPNLPFKREAARHQQRGYQVASSPSCSSSSRLDRNTLMRILRVLDPFRCGFSIRISRGSWTSWDTS